MTCHDHDHTPPAPSASPHRQIGTPQSRRHDGAIFHHAEADGILLLPQEAFRAINGIQDPEAAKSWENLGNPGEISLQKDV